MKLKKGFVLHTSGEEHMMVATGKAAKDFNGLVRSNDTANFILEKLQKEISEEQLVADMVEKYQVDQNTASNDIKDILAQLKQGGFLDD